MMAGDTLVTVSLAGSLFFSVSPDEAKGKVLEYLLFTIAPFAVVSPLLGPLIDRSSHGRRVLVALSAAARVLLCWFMSQHLTSLWLYPAAFLVLVSSKLYGVTRSTLVPEMARSDQFDDHGDRVGRAGWPVGGTTEKAGFAGFNAQLTLLGTLAGLLAGSIGAGLLKGIDAVSVLVVAAVVYVAATVASTRLPSASRHVEYPVSEMSQIERDFQALNPWGEDELLWGLAAASTMRFVVGFATFLLAFGLRRGNVGLGWYATALALSGMGSLVGLGAVTRLRNVWRESTLLSVALVGAGLGAALASVEPTLVVQTALAGWFGVCAAVAQPSFDAVTQRLVAPGAQGRTFARFAVRQQLAWVVGGALPVAVALSFGVGDRLVAIVTLAIAAAYARGHRAPETQ
jgi:MFS family permease